MIIFLAYFIGDNWFIWIKTSFSADGALTFYGSLLAFLSTSGLGVLALWQNRKFKQENDISQKKLETINTKLLEIDIKKSNNNLLEMYFQYMEENQKIYDAEYVLQK